MRTKPSKIRVVTIAATLLVAGAAGASALPLVKADQLPPDSTVQQIASWRYHQNCGWQSGRWVVDLGAGRIVACRPNRPGRNYGWRNEGARQGWYDGRARSWHYNNW